MYALLKACICTRTQITAQQPHHKAQPQAAHLRRARVPSRYDSRDLKARYTQVHVGMKMAVGPEKGLLSFQDELLF